MAFDTKHSRSCKILQILLLVAWSIRVGAGIIGGASYSQQLPLDCYGCDACSAPTRIPNKQRDPGLEGSKVTYSICSGLEAGSLDNQPD